MKPPPRILIVEGRFYDQLADALLEGARSTLESLGAACEVVTLPGALEIPAAIAMAAKWGRFDGFVALGVIIRGETYHFEIVSNESAHGLMQLGVEQRLSIGNGILTVENEEQAWARARVSEGDKGGQAARACLDLLAWKDQLRSQ